MTTISDSVTYSSSCRYTCTQPKSCCEPRCCNTERGVTDLWYFWFVLSILILLILILLIRYIKKRKDEGNSRLITVHHSFDVSKVVTDEYGSTEPLDGSKRGLSLRPPPQASQVQAFLPGRAKTPYPSMITPASTTDGKKVLTSGMKPLDPAYLSLTSRGPLRGQLTIPGYIGNHTNQAGYQDFNSLRTIPETQTNGATPRQESN